MLVVGLCQQEGIPYTWVGLVRNPRRAPKQSSPPAFWHLFAQQTAAAAAVAVQQYHTAEL